MANTSHREHAEELLAACLRGERPDPRPLLDADGSKEFFRVVVEGLSDRFDAELCAVYADVFASAVGDRALAERYRRIRRPRRFSGPDPEVVQVLSRVTIGADVAVTSVVLDAAKRRFPRSRIVLCGSAKVAELWAADPRIEHRPADYPRTGTMAERLAARPWFDQGIVLDPDSRLTQLGLLPVCEEERYYFFESRAADGAPSLAELTRQWVMATLGVPGSAYIAPLPHAADVDRRPMVTVSLGVGENLDKRVADPFERTLLETLVKRGAGVYIDKGAGGEETGRVERAIEGLDHVRFWQGAFAPFAAAISRSDLYVGYDSAGQHVAAACGVPLVSVFAGHPNERFFARWRPAGPGPIEVVRADGHDPGHAYADVLAALKRLSIL